MKTNKKNPTAWTTLIALASSAMLLLLAAESAWEQDTPKAPAAASPSGLL